MGHRRWWTCLGYQRPQFRHQRRHRLFLFLRLLFRHHHGTCLLDIPRRNFPDESSCQGSCIIHRNKLVGLFGTALLILWLNPLPRVFNFALAWAVPPGLSNIAWKTYFIFGTFNFAAFIHVLFCFPETAGRTLEEIEDVFSQGHTFAAWKIKRDVGKKTLQEVKKQAEVASFDHGSREEKAGTVETA